MATTKKTTVKKPVTRAKAATKPVAKAVTKKPTAKKAPVKKATSKKQAAASEMRSFHVAKDVKPFTTFQITRQTFYWVVLVAFIIFAQLWIISLQVEVASLLDAQQAQLLDI